MIKHPDYVKKRINKKKTPDHPEDVRYIYPMPNGSTQEDYVWFVDKGGVCVF